MNSADALRQLAPTTRILKRAQYEAFEFAVQADGIVVTNASYADPENHAYVVRLVDEIPATCTCPASARYPGACKHRVAVAIRAPVLAAAQDCHTSLLVADGSGDSESTASSPASEEIPSDEESGEADLDDTPSDCACSDLDGLPCWPCVNTGRRTIQE